MTTFSVIMNCLNGERFLKEAMDSIFAQTFTDWEVIFFDSGSTDRSVEIAAEYGQKVKIYTLEKPVPLGQARQEAVDKAKGRFLAFLDVDDVWLPHKLQVQYEVMKSGEFDICYGGVQCIDEYGRSLYKTMPMHSSGPMFEQQLRQVEGSICTYVINREKLLKKGTKFNPTLRSSSEPDMILSFLAFDGTGLVLRQVLSKYRIVTNSVTSYYSYRLAMERFSTLDRLVSERPEIKELFPESFMAAKARGHYYQARYLIDKKKYRDAIEEMRMAAELDNGFRFLSFLIRSPLIWNLAHKFKGYLGPLWLKINVK